MIKILENHLGVYDIITTILRHFHDAKYLGFVNEWQILNGIVFLNKKVKGFSNHKLGSQG